MALPGYLEDTGKDLAKQMTGAYSVPIDTTKFTGSQFVAGQDPLQTQAMGLATAGVLLLLMGQSHRLLYNLFLDPLDP